MSFAFYRTTKYGKRYIFRYRRLYHFVAIRDCWSAIIVDTLCGGQLIHSYIQDINTSLTHHLWLSGYPASSFQAASTARGIGVASDLSNGMRVFDLRKSETVWLWRDVTIGKSTESFDMCRHSCSGWLQILLLEEV